MFVNSIPPLACLIIGAIIAINTKAIAQEEFRYYRHPDGKEFKVPRYVNQGEEFPVELKTVSGQPIKKVSFLSVDGSRNPLFKPDHVRRDMKVEVNGYETKRVEGGLGKYIGYLLSIKGRQYFGVEELQFTAKIHRKGRVILNVLHYSHNDGGHNKTTSFIIDVK